MPRRLASGRAALGAWIDRGEGDAAPVGAFGGAECGSRSGQRPPRRLQSRVVLRVAIIYATVSGNAEQLAHAAAARLAATAARAIEAHNVADFPAARLGEFDAALVIASTWGEGEAPPDAVEFCAALGADAALDLSRLRYAVLALGSSTYPDFCACGKRIDADLARRGAKRLVGRVDCDTKFKADFERWLAAIDAALAEL